MSIYLTADTHFGHKNIIKFAKRPFETVKEMDQELIHRWNSKVRPNDDIYHLGDFSFSDEGRMHEILLQLNGRIHMIWGNHDHRLRNDANLRNFFAWTRYYHEINYNREKFILFHYPMFEWNKMHRGSYHCFGHVHGSTLGRGGRSMDVGVDVHDYYPVHIDEVVDTLKDKEIFTHH